MASKMKTSGSCFTYFRVLNNEDSKVRFVNGLNQIYITLTGKEISVKGIDLTGKFITVWQEHYSNLKSDHCRKEYRDAFKRHNNVITEIIEDLISACSKYGSIDFDYSDYKNNVRLKIDGEVFKDINIQPRSFRKLYQIVSCLLEDVTTADELVAAGRVITSICNISNDVRLTDAEFDKQMKEDIDKLRSTPKMTTVEDYNRLKLIEGNNCFELYQTTLEIQKYLKESTPIKAIPLWAREFVYAVRKGISKVDSVFNDKTIKYSSASSGTYVKGNGKRGYTVPGCLASMYEIDKFKNHEIIEQFDSLIGFNLLYGDNLDTETKTVSKERNSVAIEQKKPKARLIHTLSNPSHDRLTWFENIDKKVLKEVRSDCLFDQQRGPEFIKAAMREREELSIYSLDMTDATNTMLLEYQKDCKYIILEYILGEDNAHIACEAWKFLMKQQTSFKFKSGRVINYTMTAGQPMGYTDSFAAFSIGHHFILLTLMRLLDTTQGSNIYRILGDDLVIAIEDEGFEVPDLYSQLCFACNVECNTEKGYIYNPKVDKFNKPIAEFAKYLIMESFDMTAVPVKLVAFNGELELVALMCWLSEHNHQKFTEDALIAALVRNNFSKSTINYYKLKMRYPVMNILRTSFRCQTIPLDYIYEPLDIVFITNYVRECINVAFINLYYRDQSIIEGNKLFKFKGLKEVAFDYHKLTNENQLIGNKLQILADYCEMLSLGSTMALYDILNVGGIKSLTEEEKLCYTLPLIKYLEDNDPQGDGMTLLMLFIESNFSSLCEDNESNELTSRYLMQLSSVRSATLQRSWSGYALRIAHRSTEDILNDFVMPCEDSILGMQYSSADGVIDYLVNKQELMLVTSGHEGFALNPPFEADIKETKNDEDDPFIDFDVSEWFK